MNSNIMLVSWDNRAIFLGSWDYEYGKNDFGKHRTFMEGRYSSVEMEASLQ